MKRRVFPILVLLFVFLLGTTAEARGKNVTPYLSFSGTTACCELNITANAASTIEATMELWRGSTFIESWTDSATTRLYMNENHSVSKGESYTLKAYGTIDGVSFTAAEITKTCR